MIFYLPQKLVATDATGTVITQLVLLFDLLAIILLLWGLGNLAFIHI